MEWTPSIFTVVVLGGASISLYVGIVALRHRPDPMSIPLAAMMFAGAIWAIPHGISFGFSDPKTVEIWFRFQYLGAVSTPILYLFVALKYASYEQWLSRKTTILLSIIPAITMVIVVTNPAHNLLWGEYTTAQFYNATVLRPEYNIWYFINLGYLYLVTAAALGVLASVIVTKSRVYQKQATLVFLGGFVPLLTNILIEIGLGPRVMIDLTTTALAISGVIFALVLFKLDLLDIEPIAREELLKEIEDGMVVISSEGEIKDCNPAAERVFSKINENNPDKEIHPMDIAAKNDELSVEINNEKKHFRIRSTPLTDKHDDNIGKILHLDDITGVIEREQRISVLNRILRHNIRNELNIAMGRLRLLEQQISNESEEHINEAEDSVKSVINSADKARHIERTLREDAERLAVSAESIIEDGVEDVESEFPDANIEHIRGEKLDSSSDTQVKVADGRLFRKSIEELVCNAIEHTDKETPEVEITIKPHQETVDIVIKDNGPGIPSREVNILSTREETELEHGSGLGLWLVQWNTTLSSGELSFETTDTQGTTVRLTLDRPSE